MTTFLRSNLCTRMLLGATLMGATLSLPTLASAADAKATTAKGSAQTSATAKLAWPFDEFAISYWLGPTTPHANLDRYREIVASGMTYLMPQLEGGASVAENLNSLEISQKLGKKVFLGDDRLPHSISGDPEAKAKLDAIAKDYKDHPAFGGYFLGDEPSAVKFDGLGEVVAYLKKIDPDHPVFLNLFPNYASAEQLGAPDYETYVREYLQKVKPFMLSYDHYNFFRGGDGAGFFPNLDVARRLAKQFDVPFMQIVQVVQWDTQRDLTEAELRYEAYQTLAYGGKGLMWFTYWTSRSEIAGGWKYAMANQDGTLNPHYYMVQRVNKEAGAFGNQLMRAESTAVFHAGVLPPGGAARPADAAVDVTGPGNLTVGLFRNYKNESLTLVTNADYTKPVQTEVLILSGKKKPQQFDPATGKWSRAVTQSAPGGYKVALTLQPAGAALLKW
jgi:hypothetical protein